MLIAEDFLGDDDVVMYLGDNLLEQDLGAFVRSFENARRQFDPPAAQILLKQVPDPHRFGIAELDDDGNVVQLVEKPDDPPSDLALVGVYLFDASIHEAVRAIEPSPRGELEITDAIQWLIDHGRSVHPHLVSGWWKDTGKIEDMLEANRIILDTFAARGLESVDSGSRVEGKVVVEPGAKIVDSIVRGPAIVGAGAEVRGAFVGPYTSIGANVVVDHCEIENSIVLEGSRLERIPVRIADSLIGRNVRIHPGAERPRVHRFLVGDNSEIGIA
jgi:glucose-1-phosphate thymidylyltransferase